MLDYILISKAVFIEMRGSKLLHVICALTFNRNLKSNQSRFMTKAAIANMAGVSRQYASDALSRLEENGFIEQIAERRNEYMYDLNFIDNPESQMDVVDLEAIMQKVRDI